MRSVRSPLVRLAMLLCVAACSTPSSGSGDGASVSAPATTASNRTAPSLRSVELTTDGIESGDIIVALHPTTSAIELAATSDGIEVCPAPLTADPLGGTSWPSSLGFETCLPLSSAAPLQLPPTDGTLHVAFALRRTPPASAPPTSVLVRYQPADPFFELGSPPARPGARTPAVAITDPPGPLVGAAVFRADSLRDNAGLELTVTQNGRRLEPSTQPFEGDGQPFAITPGQPATVYAVNTGTGTESHVQLLVEWH